MMRIVTAGWIVGLTGCAAGGRSGGATFSEDARFLAAHSDVIVLQGDSTAQRVVVAPEYQGRVMTSTLAGPGGHSFGWINRKFIEAGRTGTEFDNFGGEDRLWFGPESGQYGLFFEAGAAQTAETWVTPPGFNQLAFDTVEKSAKRVRMTKRGLKLRNVTGTQFNVDVRREITILSKDQTERHLGMALPAGVAYVAYESRNVMTNAGPGSWHPDRGLLSIWILGQYAPAPKGVAIFPYVAGNAARLGPVVTSTYFDPVPPDRLRVTPTTILFKTDGHKRGKIGVGPRRCRSAIGAFDAGRNHLTIVQYSFTRQPRYVNSLWEVPQKEPYAGDVINSYNDGPLNPGEPPLHGGFFELETSSHADALQAHQSIEHVHRTLHFAGSREALSPIAAHALGADLAEIVRLFDL